MRAAGGRPSKGQASKHAVVKYYCSCGAVVLGNGGKGMHMRKHRQRGERESLLTVEQYREKFQTGYSI